MNRESMTREMSKRMGSRLVEIRASRLAIGGSRENNAVLPPTKK
jgi:predicted N-formylglutamate amidohydrolase